jgi:hypothetical protein
MTPAEQQAKLEAEVARAAQLSDAWWHDGIAAVEAKYGVYIHAYAVDLDPELVAARVWYETRGNPKVVSSDPVLQETGLLQLSKDSQAQYGVLDPTDPEQNLRAGCLLWSRWATSFRAWAVSSGLQLDADASVGHFAIAWLVTAIGPGAIRALAGAARSATFEGIKTWVSGNAEAYYKLHATGRLGRATAEVTCYRISIAGRAAAVAVGEEGGFMSTGQAILFALVVAVVALLAFWVWPSMGGGAA